jgi:hypothetical protein
MKKIKLILSLVLLLILNNSFAQTQEKNREYCTKVVNANEDVAVKTTFITNMKLSNSQVNQLKNDLFVKNSVYKVEVNEKHNQFIIYHLSQVSYEDLKILMSNLGVEFNYIKTEKFTNQFEKL